MTMRACGSAGKVCYSMRVIGLGAYGAAYQRMRMTVVTTNSPGIGAVRYGTDEPLPGPAGPDEIGRPVGAVADGPYTLSRQRDGVDPRGVIPDDPVYRDFLGRRDIQT